MPHAASAARAATAGQWPSRSMRHYLAPKLLIIDEFGVWPYDRLAATAFFTLVSVRYERDSIILMSNKASASGARCSAMP